MSRKEKILYPFYVISHPLDGFYEIRHRGKGSVPIALLLVFLFGLSFSLNRRYAGFVVNLNNPLDVNAGTEILGLFMIYLLFCTANWSVTCLMNGEGRLKDIITVVGYSMLPMVLTYLPVTILSWFIAADEESLYYLIVNLSNLFFVLLLIIGIMIIHNYSFAKTLVTMLLTFVSLVLILFVSVLIFTLVQQVWYFLESIYIELILRA